MKISEKLGYDITGSKGSGLAEVKAVHFANNLFTALTGEYSTSRTLNIASFPATTIKKKSHQIYALENIYNYTKEEKLIDDEIEEDDFKKYRAHLKQVFSNDRGLYAHDNSGSDFTSSSPELAQQSFKGNHFMGDLLVQILEKSPEGLKVIEKMKKIIDVSNLIDNYTNNNNDIIIPDRYLARPYLNFDKKINPYELKKLDSKFDIENAAKLMTEQTRALLTLTNNIIKFNSNNAVRQMIIGCGCWFMLYMIKQSNEDQKDQLIFLDFLSNTNPQTRRQSQDSFSRLCNNFGKQISNETDSDHERKNKVLKRHFSYFANRFGWSSVHSGGRSKYWTLKEDTLQVLLTSIIEDQDEDIDINDIGRKLYKSWRLCIGLNPEDYERLLDAGYRHLDEDQDLLPNNISFQKIAKNLGMAVDRSDGLITFNASVGVENE